MTQGKAPKYILERRMDQKLEVEPRRSRFHEVIKGILGTIGLLSAVLGIVSGWVALIPHVSVTQTQPLNLTDPFSTPFIVSNDGPLAIRDVRFECFVFSIKTQIAPASEIRNEGFVPADVYYASMRPGERATVPCHFQFTMLDPLESADMAMIVTFKVPFLSLETSNEFRFQALRAGDKNLYWFPQPLTTPIPEHSRIAGPSSAQGVNKSQ